MGFVRFHPLYTIFLVHKVVFHNEVTHFDRSHAVVFHESFNAAKINFSLILSAYLKYSKRKLHGAHLHRLHRGCDPIKPLCYTQCNVMIDIFLTPRIFF